MCRCRKLLAPGLDVVNDELTMLCVCVRACVCVCRYTKLLAPGLDVVNDERIRDSVTKLARQPLDEDVDARE